MKSCLSFAFCLLFSAAWASADEPTSQQQWPGFLGQGASAVDAETIPLEWSPTKNVAWSAALPGYGQSSPVIFGSRVFLTATEGPNKEKYHLLAFDLNGGKELWRLTVKNSMPKPNNLYVSRSAPTPICDGQHVFAFFEGGNVLAATHEGKQVWTRSLSDDYGQFTNRFGIAASLVQTETTIITLVDDPASAYLLAMNKADGKTTWKVERKGRTSWASPIMMNVAGSPQVVISSAGSVDGYDPQTGEKLWSYEDVGGNTATSVIPFGDGQFLISASTGRNGETTQLAKQSNAAMQVRKVDGKYVPEFLWKTEKATVSFGSPAVHNGYAYWVNRSGVIYCFDLKTGEEQYTKRTAESCWATPVGLGNRVYFFGKSGTTTVLATGPEFKVLAENQLLKSDQNEVSFQPPRRGGFGGPTQYGVAIVNGSLLIRTGEKLFCIRKK